MNGEAPAGDGNDVEKRAKELLDESIEHLDGRTLSRLTRARHAALDEVERSRRAPLGRWWMPATGVAMAAVLAIMVGHGLRDTTAPALASESNLLDDFEIVADADNLDMLEDVEFYSWLPDDASEGTAGG